MKTDKNTPNAITVIYFLYAQIKTIRLVAVDFYA